MVDLFGYSLTITCGDGGIDVKSTEVRTANCFEIRGFREFGVNMTGLLQALFLCLRELVHGDFSIGLS